MFRLDSFYLCFAFYKDNRQLLPAGAGSVGWCGDCLGEGTGCLKKRRREGRCGLYPEPDGGEVAAPGEEVGVAYYLFT